MWFSFDSGDVLSAFLGQALVCLTPLDPGLRRDDRFGADGFKVVIFGRL